MPNRFHIFLLILLLLSVGAAARERPPLDRFLEVDARIVAGSTDAARNAVETLAARAQACIDAGDPAEACLVRATLGDDGIAGLQLAPVAVANTVTHALVERSGSCAALVAVLLALGDRLQVPFTAIVLREHVLLGSASNPGVAYEVLDRGRPVRLPDVQHYGPLPPGGAVHVPPPEFLPYYLDNLAARLADGGNFVEAERTFRDAIRIAPKVARLRYNLGTLLVQRERWRGADRELTRAIRLGWTDADAHVNRGVARWKRGNLADARHDFEQALRLEPGNPDARCRRRAL